MAALIARARGGRGEVHRLGHSSATASVATYRTFASVEMSKDGSGVFALRSEYGDPILVVNFTAEDRTDRLGPIYGGRDRLALIPTVTE